MAITASIIGSMIMANASSGITPSIVMSRPDDGVSNPAMWVAPCAVEFSGVLTTKDGEINPFRNLHFSFDYGDGTKSNEFWANGARPGAMSKNRDIGPIGGHVYELPGTYWATLTVVDSDGKVNATRQQIVVTDPDIVYGSANTIYVSSSGNFTEALPGATQITASNITTDGFVGFATGKRLLFRGGDPFTLDSSKIFNNFKDCQIGTFGTGLADISFTGSGTVTTGFISFAKTNNAGDDYSQDNIQVFKLKITNINNVSNCGGIIFSHYGTVSSPYCEAGHSLIHKCEVYDVSGSPLSVEGKGCAISECVGIISKTASTLVTGAVGIWNRNSNGVMLIGNMTNMNYRAEHSCRSQGGSHRFIAHNTFANPAAAKLCATLRGFTGITTQAVAWTANAARNVGDLRVFSTAPGKVFRVFGVTGSRLTGSSEPAGLSSATIGDKFTDNQVTWRYEFPDVLPYGHEEQYANVYDNYFRIDDDVGVAITDMTQVAPTNSTAYEPMRYILWHGNRYSKNVSTSTGSLTKLSVQADDVIIRNNIFDMSDAPGAADVAMVRLSGPNSASPTPSPASSNVLTENNSFFSNYVGVGVNNKLYGVVVPASVTSGIIVRNNLGHAPNSKSGSTMVLDSSAVATKSNNTADAQLRGATSPFESATPSADSDFKLTSTSYAKGAGTNSTGLFIDYFGTTRSRLTAPDMGAIDARM
jgi:hypothetical protein